MALKKNLAQQSKDDEDSDSESFESIDSDKVEKAPDFGAMRLEFEMMIKGKTKAEPIDGDYSEDD